MAKFYFQLFACFCFALKWEGNVEASDIGRCAAVKTAIKKNATWTVRSAQKTITWIGYATAATKLKNCCTPEGGELGDISSVKYTDSKTDAVYSNNLCLNCPGLQDLPVTDFNFTVGTTDHGISVPDTGSCSEVSVYRCRCSKPTTSTVPPATTTVTTVPPKTCTEAGDDYTRNYIEKIAFNITADNEMKHLYIDGCEITNLPGRNNWQIVDSVPLPHTASVIAVEMFNDPGYVGGILASTDTIRTDGSWKINANYTSGWMNVSFDDSTWKSATTYGYNGDNPMPWGTIPDISRDAQWISSEIQEAETVYFRYQIKRGNL